MGASLRYGQPLTISVFRVHEKAAVVPAAGAFRVRGWLPSPPGTRFDMRNVLLNPLLHPMGILSHIERNQKNRTLPYHGQIGKIQLPLNFSVIQFLGRQYIIFPVPKVAGKVGISLISYCLHACRRLPSPLRYACTASSFSSLLYFLFFLLDINNPHSADLKTFCFFQVLLYGDYIRDRIERGFLRLKSVGAANRLLQSGALRPHPAPLPGYRPAQKFRTSETTLPSTTHSSTMIGSNASFSGCRRTCPFSQ